MSRKKTADGNRPLRVGDRVTRHPVTLYGLETQQNRVLMKCRVVYIHPRGRYHVVEFEDGFRETYPGVER